MWNVLRPSLITFFSFICLQNLAFAVQSFEDVSQREVTIKKLLPLYIQHKIGNVSIQGWVQDRIRVTIKKRVLVDTEAQAKKEFDKLDLITLETANRFEMRVGHTQGTDLVSKMRDRLQNQVQVDLEIKAPYQSQLVVVLGEGKALKLQEWRGGVEISGKANTLDLSKLVLSEPISVNCIQCGTEIRESKLDGHLLIGSKSVLLADVESKMGLSVDEGSEEVKVENSRGKLQINSKSGRLTVSKFDGTINFQSVEGGAFLNQYSGSASIQTQSGQVMLDFDRIDHSLNIDTEKSDIQVSLPASFVGSLDLMSLRGELVVQFPVESKKRKGSDIYGPASPGRIDGVVGSDDRVQIHAYSKQGGVRILRKAITK